VNTAPLYRIGGRFRDEAARFRGYGQESCALQFERCAAMADEVVRQWECELLTLDEAAAESGYSYSALEKSIRAGRCLAPTLQLDPRARPAVNPLA